jgi:hypothetical protein
MNLMSRRSLPPVRRNQWRGSPGQALAFAKLLDPFRRLRRAGVATTMRESAAHLGNRLAATALQTCGLRSFQQTADTLRGQ